MLQKKKSKKNFYFPVVFQVFKAIFITGFLSASWLVLCPMFSYSSHLFLDTLWVHKDSQHMRRWKREDQQDLGEKKSVMNYEKAQLFIIHFPILSLQSSIPVTPNKSVLSLFLLNSQLSYIVNMPTTTQLHKLLWSLKVAGWCHEESKQSVFKPQSLVLYVRDA